MNWRDADRLSELREERDSLLAIAKRWAALDADVWHPDRYESDRDELLDDTRAAIAKAERA